MAVADRHEAVIPLLEEVLRVEKRAVDTSRVAVRVRTELDQHEINQTLASNSVHIDHVSVGKFVDSVPDIRVEGDVTVFPVVEEVFVKRLFLREEVRVTRRETLTPFHETVTLRRQVAEVERTIVDSSVVPSSLT